MEFLVRLHVDANAALGIIERRGVGRVRHLDVGSLWIQEQQLRRIIELKKDAGLLNSGIRRQRTFALNALTRTRT